VNFTISFFDNPIVAVHTLVPDSHLLDVLAVASAVGGLFSFIDGLFAFVFGKALLSVMAGNHQLVLESC
jgi:hypothetical protein